MVQRSHENGEFEDREWGKERSGRNKGVREWIYRYNGKNGRGYEGILGKKDFQKWKIF